MGNNNTSSSISKVNFEDVQIAIKNNNSYLIINVLTETEQQCLIKNTLPYQKEEEVINNYLQKKTGRENNHLWEEYK